MNEEEIKEYLNRTNKLEQKLKGKDKETLQWLIFGYNKCAELLDKKEQENKQLKDMIKKAKEELEKHLNAKSYGNHKYELFSREYLEELLDLLKEIK